MKIKRKGKKECVNDNKSSKPSKEYTTEELIELGKKQNILKLAPPLYEEDKKGHGAKEQDT